MTHQRTSTLIILLALLLTAFSPLFGTVSAQDDGGLSAEEQALVERTRAAILAAEDYSAGVALTTASSTNEAEIVLGDATYPGETITARSSEHRFTRDANGLPNSVVLTTLDVSEEDANDIIRSYHLESEARTVSGAVYVQATRTSEDEATRAPMPEGWLLVTDTIETDWPALNELPLVDALREVDILSAIDPDILVLLDHATVAELGDPVTLDDGRTADVVQLAVTGDALHTAMNTLSLREGNDNSAVYTLLGAESAWTITFWLDADNVIVYYDMTLTFDLIDVDLALLNPTAPEGARFTQYQTFSIASEVTVFDAPTEPVAAPEISTPE